MNNASDFIIENDGFRTHGWLLEYIGAGGDVVIPDNVRGIAGGAFSGCKSLTSITIPNSVGFINSGAFSGCTNLTTVTLLGWVDTIDDLAFENF